VVIIFAALGVIFATMLVLFIYAMLILYFNGESSSFFHPRTTPGYN